MSILVKRILVSFFFLLLSTAFFHSRAFSTDTLVVDFGAANGLWTRAGASTWTQLHGLNPEDMATGDIDNSGTGDIIIDFGATLRSMGFYEQRNLGSAPQLEPGADYNRRHRH